MKKNPQMRPTPNPTGRTGKPIILPPTTVRGCGKESAQHSRASKRNQAKEKGDEEKVTVITCARKEPLNMSQREIVEALNYKATPLRASQISQYENGQREPTMMLVLAYARLMGISTDVLIDDKLNLPR